MTQSRIILFGGTFDPIHLGHTAVAGDAARRLAADRVVFIPAKRSPLKALAPHACDADRLAMIRLAIAGSEIFELSDYELKRPGPSYTLHTVRYFKTRFGPDTTIHWLVGVDSIDDLPHWFGITGLIDECNLSIMYRAGFPPPDFHRFERVWGLDRVAKLQANVVKTPLIDISSTEIRKRLAANQDVSDMLHPSVADYIQSHRLYLAG